MEVPQVNPIPTFVTIFFVTINHEHRESTVYGNLWHLKLMHPEEKVTYMKAQWRTASPPDLLPNGTASSADCCTQLAPRIRTIRESISH
jgi:hypothetical protein